MVRAYGSDAADAPAIRFPPKERHEAREHSDAAAANPCVDPEAGPVCNGTHRSLDVPGNPCVSIHMNSRDLIKALKADGWTKVAQKGSHVQFKHPVKPGRVTVTHPRRDLPIGTLRSIEKQSGLTFKS